jgi:hypothetical protein
MIPVLAQLKSLYCNKVGYNTRNSIQYSGPQLEHDSGLQVKQTAVSTNLKPGCFVRQTEWTTLNSALNKRNKEDGKPQVRVDSHTPPLVRMTSLLSRKDQ